MANTVNLKDKSKNIIYPATDWSVVNNKPSNLATTEDLGSLASWTTSGITFENGGIPWGGTSASDSHNCAYRIADFGTFKLVELRCIFTSSSAISGQTTLVDLPSTITPDWDLQSWYATDDGNDTQIWFTSNKVGLKPASGKSSVANHMYSFHTMYFTTA
ncbi:hypothetical protein QS460_04870 [Liquorilactobacillus mali]|uniref:hypothetical protein n=1 Tax=Liquorilactobacillus mali TaxID=1618 RepID=UPI002656A183|nr:hypothetical protein [Liquorilactobacillus mali]MDN7145256.1 hypothetical protein [Liquorilactobacillus mali]